MGFAHDLEARLAKRLADAERHDQRRHLALRRGIDFSSNDYLGFASDPVLRERVLAALVDLPLGAAGSRLLRGTLACHEAVEASLARFCGAPAALLFPSGYQANIGLLAALLTADDVVFSDAFNHASIIDGIRLGRAERHVYPHRDLDALGALLAAHPAPSGVRFIVTESLFSMDGDLAPLAELAALARAHDAALIVDESHATGVHGAFDEGRGGGLVDALGLREAVLATLHTGGKALGAGGAWVAGPEVLRDYLINFSRAFIFSTALAPSTVVALGAAVTRWHEVGPVRSHLVRARAASLQARLAREVPGFLSPAIPAEATPILPVIVGTNARAVSLAQALQAEGFDVRAIRPPTVPPGTARVRVTVNAHIGDEDWDAFALALPAILNREGTLHAA